MLVASLSQHLTIAGISSSSSSSSNNNKAAANDLEMWLLRAICAAA